MSKYTCIDLFCGAGGLSKGFLDAGYNVIAGFDHDKEALETYKKNHPGVEAFSYDLSQDLTNTKIPDLQKILSKDIDLIIGGPPCQGLSIAGKRIADDPRNKLYKAYLHLIAHYQPKAIVLENVPTIVSLFNGEIAKAIIKDFTEHGYSVTVNTVFASDYGVPQKRKRTFFIALKEKNYEFPEPITKENPITCEAAIGDLPLLDNNLGEEITKYITPSQNEYQKKMRYRSDKLYNHQAVDHKERTKEIISLVPDGGNYKDLPIELQNTRRVNIAWTRMNSKKPSFTIDAGHNHHFHYKANRVPTVRECARLQSFPDNFIFTGKRTSQYRQVGNAVPPLLAFSIAKKLMEYLYGSI